jgi:hypothetical protein
MRPTQAPERLGSSLYRCALEWALSDEVRVALFPGRAYAVLCDEPVTAPTLSLLKRAALPLLWLALLMSMMVTARVTAGIVATAALCWSFVVLLQMATGAALVASAPARSVSRRRALDLWFAAHLPYSLWLIVPATWNTLTGDLAPGAVLLTSLVPLVWTVWIASAFCRTVLGTTRSGARLRLGLHQAVTVVLVVGYVLFAGGLAGVTRYLARQFGLAA